MLRASTSTASCDTEERRGEDGKFLNLARGHRGLVYIGVRSISPIDRSPSPLLQVRSAWPSTRHTCCIYPVYACCVG